MDLQRQFVPQGNSDTVIHNETVYLSGQTGGARGSITDQTQECLRSVDDLLLLAGSSRENILSAIIWLADMEDYDDMNEVWDSWLPAGVTPARACGLGPFKGPSEKVEVIVRAAVAA